MSAGEPKAHVTDPVMPEGKFVYANLRVENRGTQWRCVYEEDNGTRAATPWRERVRFWADLGEMLGKQKEFTFRGMGTIPLAMNPKNATPG